MLIVLASAVKLLFLKNLYYCCPETNPAVKLKSFFTELQIFKVDWSNNVSQ